MLSGHRGPVRALYFSVHTEIMGIDGIDLGLPEKAF